MSASRYIVESFRTGQTIFEEGQVGKVAYVIKSGSVDIYNEVEGERIFLGRLEQGEIFGEMSIITNQPRSGTAVAHENVQLIVIDKPFMYKSLSESQPIIRSLATTLIERLKKSNKQIAGTAENSLHKSVARVLMLLHEASEHSQSIKDHNPASVSFSQLCATIKDIVPLTQADINTALSDFESRGLIRIFEQKRGNLPARQFINVPDMEKFRKLAPRFDKNKGNDPFQNDQEFVDLQDFSTMLGISIEDLSEALSSNEIPEHLLFIHKAAALVWIAKNRQGQSAIRQLEHLKKGTPKDPYFNYEA